MVELFAAGPFRPCAGPGHRSGSACRQAGSSPRKPRLHEQGSWRTPQPEPPGRDLHPLCVKTASTPQGRSLSTSPAFKNLKSLSDRTSGLLCGCVWETKPAASSSGLLRRASVELGERLSTQPSSTGQHVAGGKAAPLTWLVARFAGCADRWESAHDKARHDKPPLPWPIKWSIRMTTLWQGHCLAIMITLPYE